MRSVFSDGHVTGVEEWLALQHRVDDPLVRAGRGQHQRILGQAVGLCILFIVEHVKCLQDGSQASARYQHSAFAPHADGAASVNGQQPPLWSHSTRHG